MGLYDSYRLSQSQLVKQPTGSAISDYVKVASTLQDRYDTAVNIADEMDRQLQNAPVRPEDRPAFEQMKQKYKAGISEIAKKGDYENAVRPLTNLAKGFTGEYSKFANEIAKEQAYDKQLQEYFEKGIIKDAGNMARYKAASKKMSSGLQLDPKTGQYVGGFAGIQPAKELDYTDVTNKLLEHIKADKQFQVGLGISGDYHIKSIHDLERLGPEKIQQAFAAYASVDPEYKGYVQSMQQLRMAEVPDNALDRMPEDKQMEIRNRAIDMGMTGTQYLKAAAAQDEAKNIFSGLVGLGMKAAYQHTKDDVDFGPLTEAARKKDRKGDEDLGPNLIGTTGQAPTAASKLLSNGQPTATVWDKASGTFFGKAVETAGAVIGNLFRDPTEALKEERAARTRNEERATKIASLKAAGKPIPAELTTGSFTTLPNKTAVTDDQLIALRPLASYWARQRNSKELSPEDWTKAQRDLKNRAYTNIPTEIFTNKKELERWNMQATSSDLTDAFPVRVLTGKGWQQFSGLTAAMKELGIKGTVDQVRKSLTIAGAVGPNNPVVAGGLKGSVPKDTKDVNEGSYEFIVEVPPEQYLADPAKSYTLHEISRQAHGEVDGLPKNEGVANGLNWKYRDDNNTYEVYNPNVIDPKTHKKGVLRSFPAPKISQ